MDKELKLLVPDNTYNKLKLEASEQGVSIEALCYNIISSKFYDTGLVNPSYYSTLSLGQLREETRKVASSSLNSEDKNKRLAQLNARSLRFMRK